jgi:hypothetical protein
MSVRQAQPASTNRQARLRVCSSKIDQFREELNRQVQLLQKDHTYQQTYLQILYHYYQNKKSKNK